jgi:hypothetical protein
MEVKVCVQDMLVDL